ncbi:MAG TPA: hypothetical protein DEG96_04160 [Candidatus Atribacteria bacterium]|nr:hypothetical protein [Candidatus Atribacteria bacterium]
MIPSLELIGKFCPHPKFAQKRRWRKEEFCFFFLLRPKRGSRLGAQATESRQSRDEVRAPRLQEGGEKIRFLCPTEIFASLIKGKGGRDRAKIIPF